MRVSSIGLRGFGVHEELVLDLPDRGLVLVWGKNGIGKSTILEAVPACMWGESLRGERLPTRKGTMVAVRLGDGHVVRRLWGNTRNTVSVEGPDGTEEKPVTASKASPKVESLVGTWTAWRRTHVLSVHDAQHFSLATDRERKVLVESLVGLDRFDVAFKRAQLVARESRALRTAAESRTAGWQAKLESSIRLGTELAQAAPRPDVARPNTFDPLVSALTADVAQRRQYLSALEHQLDAARRAGAGCPTCGRPWDSHPPPVDIERLSAEVREASLQLSATSLELTELHRLRSLAERAWAVFDSLASFREAARRDKERDQLQLLEAKQAEVEVVAKNTVDEAVLSAFSPGGPRAALLRSAVARISAAATRWVSRTTDGWVIDLEFGDQGRSVDAIQLRVGPPDRLRSYRSCSNGERRRVDVGLCLALRELGARSGADVAGTLWVDDLFGGLDQDGTVRLAELLREEARRCSVVVMAPSDEIVAVLRPDKNVRIG